MSSFVTPFVAPSDLMRQTLNEFFDTSDNYDMANQTRAMRPRRRITGGEQGSFMNLNCMETDKTFMVHCEVAGVPKEHVSMNIEGNLLTIKTTKEDCCKDAACEPHSTWHCREICYGSESRFVRLPSNLNQDAVKCCYKDGVLCITFPKMETTGGMKKLQIIS